MGLPMVVMTIGSKHGQHAPLMVKKNAYASHKCGSQKTWMTIKILSLSYDSTVAASVHNDVTKIGRNLIQSLVTDSRCDNFLIYGHLIFHCVFQLKIIDCILTSLNKL